MPSNVSRPLFLTGSDWLPRFPLPFNPESDPIRVLSRPPISSNGTMTTLFLRKRMMMIPKRLLSLLTALVFVALAAFLAAPASAQRERAGLNITGYKIDAEIDTATHRLAATAVVSFTAPDNAEEVSFGFHPALKVSKITDESGKVLTGERLADGTIRVTPAAP